MNKLIDANLHFLHQAIELVNRLEDTCYSRCEPGFYNSSIGAHLRHCLEHYESFVNGVEKGQIDYDARKRDPAVETQTQAARERIETLTGFFQSLKITNDVSQAMPELQVKMDCGEDRPDGACAELQPSSMGRELQFLVSHTVHHFAMIRSLCVSNGADICDTFGVAPSTLKHRKLIENASA